jgi:hypothetical protein
MSENGGSRSMVARGSSSLLVVTIIRSYALYLHVMISPHCMLYYKLYPENFAGQYDLRALVVDSGHYGSRPLWRYTLFVKELHR